VPDLPVDLEDVLVIVIIHGNQRGQEPIELEAREQDQQLSFARNDLPSADSTKRRPGSTIDGLGT
jgi:hypothetical protein